MCKIIAMLNTPHTTHTHTHTTHTHTPQRLTYTQYSTHCSKADATCKKHEGVESLWSHRISLRIEQKKDHFNPSIL